MQSEENDLDNTFKGSTPSLPVLYFSWTPIHQILQFLKHQPARNALWTFPKRCKITQQWVLHCQAQEYAVVIPTKYNDLHGWAEYIERFIWVVKHTNVMHIVPIGGIVGLAHLLQENAASYGIDTVWPVYYHVDLDTHWTVYCID